jgi:hypothetical protein
MLTAIIARPSPAISIPVASVSAAVLLETKASLVRGIGGFERQPI